MPPKPARELPEVSISDDGVLRHLHLGTPWIQGSMLVDAPFDIALEYVQRMMAWLLFVEPDSVGGRHAMQLGLGAGAITKFCHKKLRMHATAVELNPQVLHVCRAWFKLPPEGPRLAVVLGDAAMQARRSASRSIWARSMHWPWTCTTTMPPRRCWTAWRSTPTAVPCCRTKAA